MIKYKVLQDKAKEWGVSPDMVDKDYVLGHFLNSFYSFEENKNLFAFKGGTCLRKCYFPDYRFSQDIDFTLMDTKLIVTSKFLKKIADECTQKSGILFGDVKLKSKIIHDNTLHVNEFVIPFLGANHSKKDLPIPQERWITNIELDFSCFEKIKTPVEYRVINHRYDDMLLPNQATVYSLQEIFTEKMRSLWQRNYKSSRDYYDVWYLIQNVMFENWDEICTILIEKCKDKNVTIDPYIFGDENRKYSLQKSWESSLRNQLQYLPEFETVWIYLRKNLFQKLKFI